MDKVEFGKWYWCFWEGKRIQYNGKDYNGKSNEFIDEDDNRVILADWELGELQEIIEDGEEKKCISSNDFDEKCKQETDKWITQGYWVGFCADCIGHTRAEMFRCNGEYYLRNKYGEVNLRKGRTDYGMAYFKLK